MTLVDEGNLPANTWLAATVLFERWRHAPAPDRRRNYLDSVERGQWADTCLRVERAVAFGQETVDAVLLDVLRSLDDTAANAHAAALALDKRCSVVWPRLWWEALGSPRSWRPHPGDLYPIADAQWNVPDPPGWSARVGVTGSNEVELNHLRVWSDVALPGFEPCDVVFRFDPDADRAINAALARQRAVTMHPNGELSELLMPGHPARPEGNQSGSVFPVRACDDNTQTEILTALIDQSTTARAGVAVGTETSLSPAVLQRLCDALDDKWDRGVPPIVILGSIHTWVGDEPANVACWVAPHRPIRAHRKIAPFTSEASTDPTDPSAVIPPLHEGIVPGRRRVEVWATDWARFAIVICKDLLDDAVAYTLARAGVNLLAVPSFSDEVDSHHTQMRALVKHAQTWGVLANGPTLGVAGSASFAQPVRGTLISATGPTSGAGLGWADHHVGDPARWHDL